MLQILKACHMHVTCYSFVHYIAVHACWNYKIQVGAMYKIAPEVCCTVGLVVICSTSYSVGIIN